MSMGISDVLERDFGLASWQVDAVQKRLVRPDGWHETQAINGQGKILNIAWRIPENPRAVVLVAQGRAQYAPEWIEFSDHMVEEGYAFVTYDPQGQGKSYALNPHRRHHIDNYMMTEVGDLATVVDIVETQANLQDLPKALIGHSKGGNTALRYLAMKDAAKNQFQAMALISPMTGLQYPNAFLKAISPYAPPLKTSIGHGQHYAPKQGDLTLERYLGHKHKISSDEVSQAIQWALFQSDPSTICHGPTWGFVHEALKSCAVLRQRGFAERIKIQTFWILGENEQISDNQSMIDFHARMPNSVHKIYDGAQHQVHMERPEIKSKMYRELKSFLKNHL